MRKSQLTWALVPLHRPSFPPGMHRKTLMMSSYQNAGKRHGCLKFDTGLLKRDLELCVAGTL